MNCACNASNAICSLSALPSVETGVSLKLSKTKDLLGTLDTPNTGWVEGLRNLADLADKRFGNVPVACKHSPPLSQFRGESWCIRACPALCTLAISAECSSTADWILRALPGCTTKCDTLVFRTVVSAQYGVLRCCRRYNLLVRF